MSELVNLIIFGLLVASCALIFVPHYKVIAETVVELWREGKWASVMACTLFALAVLLGFVATILADMGL